jgi:hypothetical protein
MLDHNNSNKIKCPKCGLYNPVDSIMCFCGNKFREKIEIRNIWGSLISAFLIYIIWIVYYFFLDKKIDEKSIIFSLIWLVIGVGLFFRKTWAISLSLLMWPIYFLFFTFFAKLVGPAVNTFLCELCLPPTYVFREIFENLDTPFWATNGLNKVWIFYFAHLLYLWPIGIYRIISAENLFFILRRAWIVLILMPAIAIRRPYFSDTILLTVGSFIIKVVEFIIYSVLKKKLS